MDIDEATRILLEERAEAKRLEHRQEAAAEACKRWFREHPGVTEHVGPNGRVVYQRGSQRRLDQCRVKLELGARAVEFEYEVPTETVRASAVLSPEMRASLDAETARRANSE